MWELLSTFLKVGFLSFGGGYAMIPMIQEEVVERHGWMDIVQYTDTIAIAGMAPGPIAVNVAVVVGYNELGLWGAVIAALGMILPSLAIILALGITLAKYGSNKIVQAMFGGLRPIITGLILYAAIQLAQHQGLLAISYSWMWLSMAGIFLLSLAALLYSRLHPVYVLVLSGLVGIALYS